MTHKPKIYLAGPMRNHRLYNFPAFDSAARDLRVLGWEVINPADFDRAAGFDPATLPENHDWSRLPATFDLPKMAVKDIQALATCDGIFMLRDWQGSKGAKAELAFAEWLGLITIFQ